MNSQEFRQAAHNAYAAALFARAKAFSNANSHQSYEFFKTATDAYNAASAQWIADQHTADTMAQAELDAATAKGCEEVVEVISKDFATMTVEELREYAETVQAEYDADEIGGVMGRQIVRDAWARVEQAEANTTTPQTAAEVIANINTNEAFGVAWGADGQLLTHAETAEAIANQQGWFDTQGRWVNYARMMQEAHAVIDGK
jgi:hypothetical protein